MSAKQNIQLFEKQQRIHPRCMCGGKYRQIKWLIMALTLAIYYLAPWLRWDRGPNVPDQAILIDITHGHVYFFFVDIWPQEVYYIMGLLIIAAISLFFITSLFGRVWCGYLCPQTIWVDLFIWIEYLFQGNRNDKLRRNKSPYAFDTIWRKVATHSVWILIALFTGGSWVFYFNDAPTLIDQLWRLDLSAAVFGWVFALMASTYLMAGYMREQVCVYMCPYARFQSAMFDKDTLIINYDESRGEPRGSHKAGDSWEGKGHCVNCKVCVQACPMGIDIRNGLQMECIACGLCVDACDEIMQKLNLPPNLVRYDTLRNQHYRLHNKPEKLRFFRPRTSLYVFIIVLVASVMLDSLLTRSLLDLHVIHDRNPVFVKLSDGTIRNGYDIKILNKTYDMKSYELSVSGLTETLIEVQGAGKLTADKLHVFAGSVGHFRVFVTADKTIEKRRSVVFLVRDLDTGAIQQRKSIFVSSQ